MLLECHSLSRVFLHDRFALGLGLLEAYTHDRHIGSVACLGRFSGLPCFWTFLDAFEQEPESNGQLKRGERNGYPQRYGITEELEHGRAQRQDHRDETPERDDARDVP